MIQIKLNPVQKEEAEDFCDDIYNDLDERYRTKLDYWVYSNFKSIPNLDVKFEENEKNFLRLLKAKYSDLSLIKEYIDKNKSKINFNVKIVGDSLLSNYLKNTYKKLDKKRLVRITGTTVCSYCNRNYINVTDNANTSQLDHFYNKNKYPILAVCFYNLIPSCFGCNNLKQEKEFLVSPYDAKIKKENSPIFSYIPKSHDYTKNIDSFDIIFKDNKYEKYSKSELENEKKKISKKSDKFREKILLDICTVDIHNLYQLHKDIVQELFRKNEIYSDGYKKRLCQKFEISEAEVNRMITGAYTSYDELGKRPLSKLITDISKEIGLLEEE